MNDINYSEQSAGTDKAAYEKPTMQIYEMEVEGAIMDIMSGSTGIFDKTDDSAW